MLIVLVVWFMCNCFRLSVHYCTPIFFYKFNNETVPSLRYEMTSNMLDNDAEALKELIETAEAHINGIFAFDKKYDYDCIANITDNITIEKCCCDDETDNDYFVKFPIVQEIDYWGRSELY